MNYIDSSGHNYGNPDTVQWQKKPFADVPLTDEQMDIFNRSYSPDWECRYYPIKFADYHYLIRSGFWVCKFLYSKGDDGLYHISEFYSNPDKNEGLQECLRYSVTAILILHCSHSKILPKDTAKPYMNSIASIARNSNCQENYST